MTREEMLAFAAGVCQEYQAQGLDITLRQLYYQGVARKLLPSGMESYNRLKEVLSSARLKGEFPLHWMTDRTRTSWPGRTTKNNVNVDRALARAADAVRALPDQLLDRDPWFGQPNHVSVWFEKDALSGVFESACASLGVSYLACRGDTSHATIYQWLSQVCPALGIDNAGGWQDARGNAHKGLAKRAVVLYFGDHDPTGIRIPRTLEATARAFMGIMGVDFPLEFKRVALTLDQARELNLPPFPAKVKAADYAKYVEEFGTDDAWELDALDPATLVHMVQNEVNALFDQVLYAKLDNDVQKRRHGMRRAMQLSSWREAATTFSSED